MSGTKKLFVAMPYGKRVAPLDYDNPGATVEIDFDAVWDGIIQPAVPPGYQTKRADELRQPGLIDRLYNEWLFDADIVLADLTFGNPNVYYELGIRQALSKKGTVLVACKGTKLPFDVRNQYVLPYDYFAAPTLRAFQTQLREAIDNASDQELDSPVHVFLSGLFIARYSGDASPERTVRTLSERVKDLEAQVASRQAKDDEDRLVRKLQEANSPSRVLGLYRLLSGYQTTSIDLLEQMAISLRKHGYFDEALSVLRSAQSLKPSDPEVLREIGFVYRKKGPPFYPEAEKYMRQALTINDADPELHGMLGGLLKRREDYANAHTEYVRAHELDPRSLYPLVNLGCISAAMGDRAEARAWYERLRTECSNLIKNKSADYWTYLCLGEAAVALGDAPAATLAYEQARRMGVPTEDLRSAVEQLSFFVKWNFQAETAASLVQTMSGHLS